MRGRVENWDMERGGGKASGAVLWTCGHVRRVLVVLLAADDQLGGAVATARQQQGKRWSATQR